MVAEEVDCTAVVVLGVELLPAEVVADTSTGTSLTSVMAESLEITDSIEDFRLLTESWLSSLLPFLLLSWSCSAMETSSMNVNLEETSPLQNETKIQNPVPAVAGGLPA